MNSEKVNAELSQKYPNKKIIKLPEDNPTEILCEIDPAINHFKKSVAIAIIDKSESHYHKKATETYKVIKGILSIVIDGQKNKLEEGDSLSVKPRDIHYAIGDETWVEVYSKPGWVPEDHILVK